MKTVTEFASELQRRSNPRHGRWHRVDLHNHSPTSFDYAHGGPDALALTAARIREQALDVVMFTDHGELPDRSFIESLQKLTGKLILRGVELNVFVDAWSKPHGKVEKSMFFHLLIGFDPENSRPPDYWIHEIYQKCDEDMRDLAGTKVRGVRAPIDKIHEVLRDSNAILIPAHLHSTRDAFKSRSIDDIYSDPEFLRHAREHFTALEVVSPTTAAFFDGKHAETGNLECSCVQSSDAHEPSRLGERISYVQMEHASFAELKAGLELPFRTSIVPPTEPASYIIGVHVDGVFLKDLWLTFSPNCNVFMGVKGSGKTSLLECLRFALGSEVPASRRETVDSHLGAILGSAGTVTVLIKREDGARLLVRRSLADRTFQVTFEDDRTEIFQRSDSLHFPTYILGWHEIEHAATDANIRRMYMDAIAGRTRVRELDERAEILSKEIQSRHDQASSRYSVFRGLHQQVARLEELRKGLQTLKDGNLIDLRDKYQLATDDREMLRVSARQVTAARGGAVEHIKSLLAGADSTSENPDSPLQSIVAMAKGTLKGLVVGVEGYARDVESTLTSAEAELARVLEQAETAYQAFRKDYGERVEKLTDEQRRLLETHRVVMEETRALAQLQSELAEAKEGTEAVLQELMARCDEVAAAIDAKSNLRRERVAEFNATLKDYGVRIETVAIHNAREFQDYSSRYATGAKMLSDLQAKFPARLGHLCVRSAYRSLFDDLDSGYGGIFSHAEIGYFLRVFDDDDLRIALKVGKAGEEFSPIDQLSAGQRCTAMFPLLLKLERGPLVVDQPEDNLDNRHIAGSIAPVLLHDKRTRQMMFTSHNANLVVLSDAEAIFAFESDGAVGRVNAYGFLATRDSLITQHVIDILDGGETALRLRNRKYGQT